jgi:hypothetical protein
MSNVIDARARFMWRTLQSREASKRMSALQRERELQAAFEAAQPWEPPLFGIPTSQDRSYDK